MPQFQRSQNPDPTDSPINAGATFRPGLRATDLGSLDFIGDLPDPNSSALLTGLPTEMGASEPAHTPEHFLAASLASCLGLTLQLIMQRRQTRLVLEQVDAFVDLAVSSNRIPRIAKVRAVCRFRGEEPVLYPETIQQVRDLMAQGERHCLISQALAPNHPLTLTGLLPDGRVITPEGAEP